MHHRSVAPVLGLVLSALLPACSGEAQREDSAADEGALARARTLVPDAARLQFETRGGVTTLGAKAKVQKALSAFKKATGDEVLPRCNIAPATKVTFFDKGGEVVATGSYVCFRGTIKLAASGEETRVYFHPGDLSVLDEPMVPADVLFNVTKIGIEKGFGPSAKKVEVSEGRNLAKVLAAFDAEAELLPQGPVTRCPPNHRVTFYRGHDDVGQLTYVCGDSPAGKVNATFSIPNRAGEREGDYEAKGDVRLDAPAVQRVFDDEARDLVP
ncbi:MAG: hypothetical protein IPG50_33670 [Myxococcales bacterium]|nr:hypothetical protein [Myxococcales bacterium]